MGLDALRQGADALLRNSRKGGGGGRRANWRQRFDIPIKPSGAPGDISEPIMFCDAEYEDMYTPGKAYPFFHFKQHRYSLGQNQFRTIICSGGPALDKPCIGCWDYAHGKKWAEPKDYVGFNIVHLGWYHDVPLLDKNNQIIYKQNEPGQAVIVRDACEATGTQLQCKWCQAGYQRVYGAHRYLEVGTGHLESIFNWDKELQQTCVGCGSQVMAVGYKCGNCKVDLLTTAQLMQAGYSTQEQVNAYIAAPQPCYQCQSTVPLLPSYECGYVKGVKMGRACPPGQTKVATLFDSVIYVYREKGKLTTLVGMPKMSFEQFRAPQGGKTPTEVLAEVYKTPFNFAELYEADSLEDQAKRLGCQNPYAAQQPGYSPYQGPAAWQQPGQQQSVPPPQYPQNQQPQYQQPPAGNVPPPPPPPSPGVPGAPPRPNYGGR